MTIILIAIWITSIVILILSLIWFLLGTTAFFNRGIDLITTVTYILVWVPALLLVGVSILLLKKGWYPNSKSKQIGMVMIIVILSVIFTKTLFKGVNTKGWLTEEVRSDYIQITSDMKYEYKLELVNLFQRNSYAKLYVKDLSVNEEMMIPVNIQTREISAITVPDIDESYNEEDILFWVWTKLEPSDVDQIYILTTTSMLKDKIEEFEINMKEKTLRRLK